MKIMTMARTLLVTLALGAAAPSFAVPLMDMHADDLLAMAQDFRQSLNLNPNQQTLWQKVESRSHDILRERASRRERLQQDAGAMLARQGVELRDLNARIETEAGLAAAEDKQLRELWLTMNDALDDQQRRQVATFVTEQMMRVAHADGARGERPSGGRGEGGGRRGMGGQRGQRGGGMGMPGS